MTCRVALIALLICAAVLPSTAARSTLNVCADPNNLPFSNDRLEGFENALASMVAADLHVPVRYTWWAQRRGFVRNTLNARSCDVVMGMPSAMDNVLTTRPYYRSEYVIVTARDRGLTLTSLDDPRLATLRVGVQMIGDDFTNSPPAHMLSARGITRNIVGYSVLGDYSQPNPPARIIDAVAAGDIDVAIVWGPLAGFFARHASARLTISPLQLRTDAERRLLSFDISMAVRKGDVELQRALDRFITRHRVEIDRLLARYGVPRVTSKVSS